MTPTAARRAGPDIALALPDLLPLGGAERAVLALSEQLAVTGRRVDLVLGIEQRETTGFVAEGVRVISFKKRTLKGFLPPFVRYLRQERPAAVVASMWPFTSLCVVGWLLAGARPKMVVLEQNTLSIQYGSRGVLPNLLLRSSLALTYRLVDDRLAVSKGVALDTAALTRLEPGRFAILHNPLSISDQGATEEDCIAENAWNGWSGKRILTVGRLKPQKNQELLMRAFARLPESLDAKLMIVGIGPLAEQLPALARELGLANRVLFPGHVDDPSPFYRVADLFVLSSDFEGCPNVIVEALAFGLPVVATDCRSGPAEILDDGRYGTLVPVGDVDALARAVAHALTVGHDRDALISRAHEFSPADAAQALVARLELIQRPRA